MSGFVQVTRLLVDAVTISTANSEREHCFLPSHKGSPYHVHKLAERILPAELLQVCGLSVIICPCSMENSS